MRAISPFSTVMFCTVLFLAGCTGPSHTAQTGAADGGFEIGATNVAQSTMAWVGKAAKNMKDHWVMPQDATVQYLGGSSSARQRARQQCVQQAIFAAESARQGNRHAAQLAGSAGGRYGAPALARSASSSYMGRMQTNTWMDPLLTLGAAAATTAFTDNLQTVIDQATTECMRQQGFRPQPAPAAGY